MMQLWSKALLTTAKKKNYLKITPNGTWGDRSQSLSTEYSTVAAPESVFNLMPAALCFQGKATDSNWQCRLNVNSSYKFVTMTPKIAISNTKWVFTYGNATPGWQPNNWILTFTFTDGTTQEIRLDGPINGRNKSAELLIVKTVKTIKITNSADGQYSWFGAYILHNEGTLTYEEI